MRKKKQEGKQLTFLGHSIPNPKNLSNKAFIKAANQLFYDLVLLIAQYPDLEKETSSPYIKALLKTRLQKCSPEERGKLAAWYCDSRFLRMLAIIEVNTECGSIFDRVFLKPLIETHKAKDIESGFNEVIQHLLQQAGGWFSTYNPDLSIINILIDIEQNEQKNTSLVKKLNNSKKYIESIKTAYEERQKAETNKPKLDKNLGLAEKAVKHFFHSGVQDITLRIMGCFDYLIDQINDYQVQQKSDFSYEKCLSDVLRETVYGFRGVKVNNIQDWGYRYFLIFFKMLNERIKTLEENDKKIETLKGVRGALFEIIREQRVKIDPTKQFDAKQLNRACRALTNKFTPVQKNLTACDIFLLVVGIILALIAIALAVYLTVQTLGIAPALVGMTTLAIISGGVGGGSLLITTVALRKKISALFTHLFTRNKNTSKSAPQGGVNKRVGIGPLSLFGRNKGENHKKKDHAVGAASALGLKP